MSHATALPPCIVIARVAPRRAWPTRDRPVVDLILPHDPANPGRVVTWDAQGGHCEADTGYLRETRPPRTPAERTAAAAAVRAYRRFMAGIPRDCRQDVVERVRMPVGWRRVAWATRGR